MASRDESTGVFEKRFERSFPRVYTYVFSRVGDHAIALRLTREVLTRTLHAIVDAEEPDLDVVLIRAANRLLRAAARAERRR